MRENVSISLPEDIKSELDRFSEDQGVSRSDTVREALREYFFTYRFRALRARMMPFAEARDIFSDEDVFREIS